MASETCEVFLCVDSAGNYGVGKDEAAARENYESDVQALSDADGFRLVKVTVAVPLPEMVELVGEAPAEGTAKLLNVA